MDDKKIESKPVQVSTASLRSFHIILMLSGAAMVALTFFGSIFLRGFRLPDFTLDILTALLILTVALTRVGRAVLRESFRGRHEETIIKIENHGN